MKNQKSISTDISLELEKREYALRTLPEHRRLAGRWDDLYRLLTNFDFLEDKCRFLSVYDLELDYRTTLQAWQERGMPIFTSYQVEQMPLSQSEYYFKTLAHFATSLSLESHNLRLQPRLFFLQMYNRLQGIPDETICQILQRESLGYKKKPWLRSLQPLPTSLIVRKLIGSMDGVLSCAVSSDMRYVVSGCSDGTLNIWDFSTGELLHSFQGHKSDVNTCIITSDNRTIISGSKDGDIKLWDIKTGDEIHSYPMAQEKHKGSVESCSLGPDGKKMISASLDGTIRVWNIVEAHLELEKILTGHKGGVRDCAFIENNLVVSVSNDMTVKIWDIESGGEVSTITGQKSKILSCALTHNAQIIFTGSADSKIEKAALKSWDRETNQELNNFVLSGDASVHDIAALNNNRNVAIALDDHTVRVFDVNGLKEKLVLRGHSARVMCCAATPNSRYLVSGSKDRSLIIWDLASADNIDLDEYHHADRIWSCAISNDGNYVVSGSNDKTVKVWDLHSRKEIRTFFGHEKGVFSCVVSRDGLTLITSSEDRTIRSWDFNTGKEILVMRGHNAPVRCCAITPDNKKIISASDDSTVKLWNAITGEIIKTFYGHKKAVLGCSVSPDGKTIASVSEDNTFRLWDVDTGIEKATIIGHQDAISACNISPNGKYVLTASYDSTLKLWDLQSTDEVISLVGHTDRVLCCMILPDGFHAVSVSADESIKIWDLNSGENITSYVANGDLRCCACSQNGSNMIVGNGLGFLYFFEFVNDYISFHL